MNAVFHVGLALTGCRLRSRWYARITAARYNQGRGPAPARSLDTIAIATVLSEKLMTGKLSREEYEMILATTSKAALAGAI